MTPKCIPTAVCPAVAVLLWAAAQRVSDDGILIYEALTKSETP
jgi:hypothetical protein